MTLIKILLSKRFLPLHALILGYMLWMAAAYNTTITTTINVPIIFYNQSENTIIESAETVQATLALARSTLTTIRLYEPAIYIDAQTLHLGKNEILLYGKDISLPDKANLIKLVPAHSIITLLQTESQS